MFLNACSDICGRAAAGAWANTTPDDGLPGIFLQLVVNRTLIAPTIAAIRITRFTGSFIYSSTYKFCRQHLRWAAVAQYMIPFTKMSRWSSHPRGLTTLFFTEMWERFSYYGMRAFLILYMTAPAVAGGLGFTDADAASIYGTYTGSVWAAAIVGGFIADRGLG